MAQASRLAGLLLALVLFAAGSNSEIRAAEIIKLDDDGWYTWRVKSVGEYEEQKFYVQVQDGKAKEIEIVGRWCDGWHRSEREYPEAVDLGLLEADPSIDWFEQYIGKRSDLGSDALAAISMHKSERALQVLVGVVESDVDMDVREEAVFWMTQSGSEAAFEYLDRLLMAK
jgi:hypothetical protein